MYPAVPVLNRVASHDYPIPGTNKVLEKGTSIFLPLLGAQRDPKYFPDPDNFVPERFSEENKRNMNGVYYPFGEGPRICIGMRLGKIQSKIGLAIMMQKFKYDLGDNMNRTQLELSPKVFIMTPVDGIVLKVSTR